MFEKPNPPGQVGAFQRTWGVRFSPRDALALVVMGAAIIGLHRMDHSFWWVVAIVAAHFFLFCNIFRVARRRELLWAAIFVANVALWGLVGRLDWFNVMACQLPVSVGVIAWEFKAPRYHGVFADRVNRNLNDYLDGHIS